MRRLGRISNQTTRCVLMATNRKTILETVPDTGENSQCSSSQQDVPHRDTQTAIGHFCVGGQRAQSMRRSLCCAVSQLIQQWMLASLGLLLWELSGVVLDARLQHVLTLTMGVQLSKLSMSMHEDACRWQYCSVTITCMAISSRRWAELRLRGRVRAWTEACW